MNADEFGLPQKRRRLYIVGLLKSAWGLPDQIFSRMESILESFKLNPFPIECFLESPSSIHVMAELSRRQESDAAGSSKDSKKWVTSHMNFCESHGLKWPVPRPVSLAMNPWFGCATDREKELIALGHPEKCLLIRDVSQSLGRTRDRHDGLVGTILPGSHFWFYPQNRYLIGRDCLNLQGFPWQRLPAVERFSEAQLADLAGNGFACPCSLALDLAIILSVLTQEESGTKNPKSDFVSAESLAMNPLRKLFAGECDSE